MQQHSQGTAAQAAAASKSAANRIIEAARARSAAAEAEAERARYVEPGLARLLGQVPQDTDPRGSTK
ncbi:hypothetical protein [Pararobbsia alpina]|uniref:Uncharacterized protein n=1 Tax=Pararobbsia alpina TaxID=621374 RepID=A0A6S7CIJ3_9BURK|nr:hypothetical protein [Pararobbsia alpina]CAB3790808.1 hypothetical protein LMG28138_03026 [Pararobbsia alpina]